MSCLPASHLISLRRSICNVSAIHLCWLLITLARIHSVVSARLGPVLPATPEPLRTNNRSNNVNMRIGRVVPDFRAHTTEGPIHFHKWQENSWVALFVPSGAGALDHLGLISGQAPKFQKHSVQVLALTCCKLQLPHKCSFPVILDKGRELAVALGIRDKKHLKQDEADAPALSLFVIGSDHKLKLSMEFPATTEQRDIVDEVLLVVNSLRYLESLPGASNPSWALAAPAQCSQCDGLDTDSHEHRLRCSFHANTAQDKPRTLSQFYSLKLEHCDKMWV